MSGRRRSILAVSSAIGLTIASCGSAGGSNSAPGTTAATTSAGVTAVATATTATPAPRPRAAALLKLRKIGNFDQPVYVTSPPGDRTRLFVVEQGGTIRVVRNGKKLATPFANVRSLVSCCGEQGLLSIAFAPDYARSGRLYAGLTFSNGDDGVIELRRATADRARTGARTVLRFSDPESNHNGGLVTFGPDKLLYYGVGDGGGAGDQHGSRGNGQNLNTLLGKILRINPLPSGGRAYSIPSSNPFVGRSGARGEIWSWGLRNPWRFAFDRKNGDLAIADVGQNDIEEIDFASKRSGAGRGVNYGWRAFEGTKRFSDISAPGAVGPVFQYSHSSGGCSITGGYIVRDPALTGFVGSYLYGDYCDGRLRAVKLRDGGSSGDRKAAPNVSQLSSFGEDAVGRVYVTSLDGPVYRLSAG
jgi:glucose/arabinose dehydrogenase